MKEKLIDLLTDNLDRCDNPLQRCSDEQVERLAEHLIQNGVILPPCNVGDMVYKVCDIESVHRQILEMEVFMIEFSSDKEMVYLKTTKKYRYNYSKATFDDFGKSVFLSREEAEKKLKEYKGE